MNDTFFYLTILNFLITIVQMGQFFKFKKTTIEVNEETTAKEDKLKRNVAISVTTTIGCGLLFLFFR